MGRKNGYDREPQDILTRCEKEHSLEGPHKLVAYHEAAHAVMAVHVGAKFEGVGICPDAKGLPFEGAAGGIRWPRAKRKRGLILLAGMAAITILKSPANDEEAKLIMASSASDFDAFRKLWPTDEEMLGQFCVLWDEARDYLSDPDTWRQVTAVAKMLVERRVLDYDMVCLRIEVEKAKGARSAERPSRKKQPGKPKRTKSAAKKTKKSGTTKATTTRRKTDRKRNEP